MRQPLGLVEEGFKVYSPELVLRIALGEEIEWENEVRVLEGDPYCQSMTRTLPR